MNGQVRKLRIREKSRFTQSTSDPNGLSEADSHSQGVTQTGLSEADSHSQRVTQMGLSEAESHVHED